MSQWVTFFNTDIQDILPTALASNKHIQSSHQTISGQTISRNASDGECILDTRQYYPMRQMMSRASILSRLPAS